MTNFTISCIQYILRTVYTQKFEIGNIFSYIQNVFYPLHLIAKEASDKDILSAAIPLHC